jgi:hypothetical protein
MEMARAITSREKTIVEHLAKSFPLEHIRAATHLITGGDGARIEALCISVPGNARQIHIERDRIASSIESAEDFAKSIEEGLLVEGDFSRSPNTDYSNLKRL